MGAAARLITSFQTLEGVAQVERGSDVEARALRGRWQVADTKQTSKSFVVVRCRGKQRKTQRRGQQDTSWVAGGTERCLAVRPEHTYALRRRRCAGIAMWLESDPHSRVVRALRTSYPPSHTPSPSSVAHRGQAYRSIASAEAQGPRQVIHAFEFIIPRASAPRARALPRLPTLVRKVNASSFPHKLTSL